MSAANKLNGGERLARLETKAEYSDDRLDDIDKRLDGIEEKLEILVARGSEPAIQALAKEIFSNWKSVAIFLIILVSGQAGAGELISVVKRILGAS